ncbi:hypothetical protein GCM10010420_28800 [Streptomyces glaucosporus]|uniref:Uncharacterized protein n=1 Tax=Streptomyces glaucosporus TaxID=284044 RepID=A0ABP5VIL9_9ACTN
MDNVTDPRGVCRRRAENLAPEVPYVRGWAEGKRSADALATVLRGLGLDSDFPGLKADVNEEGDGVVCLGTIRPEAAELLASMLIVGLTVEMATQLASAPPNGPDTTAA